MAGSQDDQRLETKSTEWNYNKNYDTDYNTSFTNKTNSFQQSLIKLPSAVRGTYKVGNFDLNDLNRGKSAQAIDGDRSGKTFTNVVLGKILTDGELKNIYNHGTDPENKSNDSNSTSESLQKKRNLFKRQVRAILYIYLNIYDKTVLCHLSDSYSVICMIENTSQHKS